jgi:hypothetical protein
VEQKILIIDSPRLSPGEENAGIAAQVLDQSVGIKRGARQRDLPPTRQVKANILIPHPADSMPLPAAGPFILLSIFREAFSYSHITITLKMQFVIFP